jgi:hypothetical protein
MYHKNCLAIKRIVGTNRHPQQSCGARYIAGGRGKGEPDTGTNHVGFRMVKSAGTAAGSGR